MGRFYIKETIDNCFNLHYGEGLPLLTLSADELAELAETIMPIVIANENVIKD